MGCVYIDTCSTILRCKLITYNFKNLPETTGLLNRFKKLNNAKKNRRSYRQIFKIVCNQFASQNRQARVNKNATNNKKKQFSKTLIRVCVCVHTHTRPTYCARSELYKISNIRCAVSRAPEECYGTIMVV